MQAIVNRLSNAFNVATKVTKFHISAVNTSARIFVLEKHEEMDYNVPRLKRSRPIGSKDIASCKMRRRNQDFILLTS